jgi:hypothetical protein
MGKDGGNFNPLSMWTDVLYHHCALRRHVILCQLSAPLKAKSEILSAKIAQNRREAKPATSRHAQYGTCVQQGMEFAYLSPNFSEEAKREMGVVCGIGISGAIILVTDACDRSIEHMDYLVEHHLD